ncbi:TP53 regulating kinase [Globomyces sp. JEL0801]|nr:TP53 regulating kinase [Globomyces sp. JEL0801]
MVEIIKQGAEAKVYILDFGDRKAIAKQRFKKAYRHPTLDKKLTSKRVIQESRSLQRLKQLGLDTPTIYQVDLYHSTIYMEYIQGQTLRDYLLETDNLSIASVVGQQLALIHDTNLIHGDLTTSNLLLRKDNTANVVWIDFGLSYVTTLVEDKAVDMYVLERSLLSTHPKIAKAFVILLMLIL